MRTGGEPKPEGQKVTRHKLTLEDVFLPPEGRQEPPPKPSFPLETPAKRLWRAMWASPEAVMWRDVDIPVLSRLVMLQSSPEASLDPRLLAEMRQIEDRFGLNPYARRQLRWKMAPDAEESTSGAPERPADDRRKRLKVV